MAWRAALLDFWLLLFGIVPHLPCSFGRACLIERLSDGLADVVLGTLGDALRVEFGEAVEERRFPFDVGSSAFRPCDERFEREALVDPIELGARRRLTSPPSSRASARRGRRRDRAARGSALGRRRSLARALRIARAFPQGVGFSRRANYVVDGGIRYGRDRH